MTREETVSVVIPAFNAESYIGDAVKSCFGQSYRPIEIVVVNDGSTDETVDVVENLSELIPDNDINLKLIDLHENKGAANALNLGFSTAKGDYVCWLSADDMFIDSQKIERQLERMKTTGAHWSYFQDLYKGAEPSKANIASGSFLPHLRVLDPFFIRDHELRLISLFFHNPINGSSVMIRKSCVETCGEFDPATKNVDADGDLWMRYSALQLKLVALKGASVFYRLHSLQTSKRKKLMIHGSELTRMRMLLTVEEKGDLTRLIKKFAPCFPVVFTLKQHFERPFVSEFLSNYINDHRNEFDRIFVKYVLKKLSEVKNHANYLLLEKDKFRRDLQLFMKTNIFKGFRDTFLKASSVDE